VISIKKLTGYVIAIAFLAIPLVMFWQRQAILDWWLLRDFTPSTAVSTLASQDTMTEQAQHVFYINHPEVVSGAATFRQKCASTEQTIVLGCYHGNQRGIYVYDVKNDKLAGVEQVTAAHEMLHAAYDRLSDTEKKRVNALLTAYYKNQVTDQRLIDTINSYKKTEPDQVVNEMHSILGTEVASLPPALESYYKQYFSNRQAVVVYASAYQAEFTNRTNQINADDAKLKDLKASIDKDETSLALQQADLEASRVRLDNLKQTGQIGDYNASVPNYNAKVGYYNANVIRVRANIETYNSLVATRNALAGELRALDEALDTRLQTQSTQ
jgi:hypothetical protein